MVPDENFTLLQDAIARNSPIVLSLPSSGAVRHQKSRLLQEAGGALWIEASREEIPLIEELIRTGKEAGISFRCGENKIIFTSSVFARDPAFRLNTSLQTHALRLRMPDKLLKVQRRSSYRVRVCEEEEVRVRVWRIPPRAQVQDRPIPSAEIRCKLINLSPGGAGVMLFGSDGQPPVVSVNDRLRLELAINDHMVLVEGAMRYPEVPPRETSFRAGIQFILQEGNLKGRQVEMKLTRLIGELQRQELRQVRLGLA